MIINAIMLLAICILLTFLTLNSFCIWSLVMMYCLRDGNTFKCGRNLLLVGSGRGQGGEFLLNCFRRKWKSRSLCEWENSREGGLQCIARKSYEWSFMVDVYTQEIERIMWIIFILYTLRQINQQQNKLDDCHFVYIHFKLITLDEILLVLWRKCYNVLRGNKAEGQV